MPAHVSLFHSLPGACIADIETTVAGLCRGQANFAMRPISVHLLGRGVAIAYDAPELAHVQGVLAREWRAWLSAQDRQPFKAHVTIQNKVAPAEARALRDTFDLVDAPVCRIEGLTLWRYLGGPWDLVATHLFRGCVV